MKDDLKKLDEQQAGSEGKASELGYESNDSWEFEAKAPTLEDTLIENGEFEIEIPGKKNDKPEDKEREKSKEKYNSRATSAAAKKRDSSNTTKFLIAAILVVAVIGVCSYLGIRYYRLPLTAKYVASDSSSTDSTSTSEYEFEKYIDAETMTPGNTALTVDGVGVSVGMYNFYYNSIVKDYIQYADSYGIDTTKDYSKQTTTDDDGKTITWQQKFEDDTIYQIQYVVSLYKKAKDAGATLTDDDKEDAQSNLDSIVSAADEDDKYKNDVNGYIAENYGDYCSYATIAKMLYQSYLARGYYYQNVVETKATNEEVENYFNDNKSTCEAQSFAYLMIEYSADDDADSENSLESVKKSSQEYIDEISKEKTVEKKKAKLKSLIPTACSALVDEYMSYYDKTEDEAVKEITDNFSEASLTSDDTSFTQEGLEWLFNDENKAGDLTTVVDSDKAIVYVVLKTGEVKLLDDQVYSVRHILIAPEDDGNSTTDDDGNTVYSDDAWASAKEQADALLNQFNEGDKTEYSFARLAEKNSTDTYSISSGGQGNYGGYYGGTALGEMVTEFEDWATDSSRKYGDVGIVKTKFGYHIMFFIENTKQYLYKCSQAVIVDKCQKAINDTVDNAKVVRHKQAMKNTTVAAPSSSSDDSSSESTTAATDTTAAQGDAYDDDSDNMDY